MRIRSGFIHSGPEPEIHPQAWGKAGTGQLIQPSCPIVRGGRVRQADYYLSRPGGSVWNGGVARGHEGGASTPGPSTGVVL